MLDCTFLDPATAYARVADGDEDVVGVYSMLTMRPAGLEFSRLARQRGALTIVGGPLPSCDPESFVDDFDLVVRGEGEQTIVEILAQEQSFGDIPGVVFREGGPGSQGAIVHGPKRPLREKLDEIALPARDLLPNRSYIAHWLAPGRNTYDFRIDHARLPVPLRVLQQRRLWGVVPGTGSGRRGG